jgi:hypothetical protein
MPLDVETYRSNAKQCENRAEQMPPGLRRDLLVAARQWRKLAAIADEGKNDLLDKTTLSNRKRLSHFRR